MTFSVAFALLWAAWLISWWIAAFWASPPQSRPPPAQERPYWLVTLAGSVLLFLNFRTDRLDLVWTSSGWAEWVLLVIAAAGLAFTWWARIHLGTLWSGRVTRKPDHRIVDTGPYAFVRHPIYSGILIAIYASALLRPGLLGLAGAALLTISFVIKGRLEERFLRSELGSEDYDAYRARVPMLVPFRPVRH